MIYANPQVKLPHGTVIITVRAEYITQSNFRGMCCYSGHQAAAVLFRLYGNLRKTNSQTRSHFKSYINKAQSAGNRYVCIYSSVYSKRDNELFRVKRRAVAEHEHAHALMLNHQRMSDKRWLYAADRVMYATCRLDWVDLKEAVRVTQFRKRADRSKYLNDDVVTEALARIAAVMNVRSDVLKVFIANDQLDVDPLSLFVVSQSVEERFKTFNSLVHYVSINWR